jgi:developmental checkpoint coupling sporulation initiation to replication initiation
MEQLTDKLLLESYYKATELKLSPDFILLIRKEIQKRCLTHKIIKRVTHQS